MATAGLFSNPWRVRRLVPIEVGSLAACRVNEPGLKIGQPHVIRHRSPLIATWWLTRQKYRTHRKSGRKSPFCCPLWPDIPLKNPRGRLSQGGSHHGIHQLHSDQHASARIEPALVTGNDLAFVQGHRTETHNHRSACAGTGLAASRRPSLVVQKIYRGGGGLASSIPRQLAPSPMLVFPIGVKHALDVTI
jgi:hypothetical protein